MQRLLSTIRLTIRLMQESLMAIIEKFVVGTRDLKAHKTSGICEAQEVKASDGRRLLQLSTFGSTQRKGSGVTQTFQLGRKEAEELIVLLERFVRG